MNKPNKNTDEQNEEVSEIDNGKTITDEIDTIINERDQYKNIAQRAQADLINYKNRVIEDRESNYVMIVTRFVSNLLPIIDNFNRAINAMPDDNSWYQGLIMIEKSLNELIQSEGITQTAKTGMDFDPKYHEAIMAIEDDSKNEGTIADIIAQGYELKDRIIRPAQVTVIRNIKKEKEDIDIKNQNNSSNNEGDNNG
ncbi:MAG: nucleotide exchange factor GrpE [Dehalococcoidia bacterium]|tara:strand:+ start:2319 stop:2909 length:591 start_codon:yes stop_codon:yes gene_type:complete